MFLGCFLPPCVKLLDPMVTNFLRWNVESSDTSLYSYDGVKSRIFCLSSESRLMTGARWPLHSQALSFVASCDP